VPGSNAFSENLMPASDVATFRQAIVPRPQDEYLEFRISASLAALRLTGDLEFAH
jgi:hypothetical protein